MKKIGLLPASGRATRLKGIPKFCLPINEDETLLEWHCRLLDDVCDEIRISTRSEWMPIVNELNLPNKVSILEIPPSTMPDAVSKLRGGNLDDLFIIGMPDTFIAEFTSSFYESLSTTKGNVGLALWPCTEQLRGKVGQIDLGQSGEFLDAKDKIIDCRYPFMWGGLAIKGVPIQSDFSNFTELLNIWRKSQFEFESFVVSGNYMDLGSYAGIELFYTMKDSRP